MHKYVELVKRSIFPRMNKETFAIWYAVPASIRLRHGLAMSVLIVPALFAVWYYPSAFWLFIAYMFLAVGPLNIIAGEHLKRKYSIKKEVSKEKV